MRTGVDDKARRTPDRPITAVGAIVLDGRRVLLVKRANAPAAGKWSIPGGVVEAGEILAEAVAREVREECSIEVEAGPLVEVVERIDQDDDGGILYHYVILDFLAEYLDGEPVAGSDAGEARWVALDALSDLNCTDGLEEVLEKARALAKEDGEE